MTPDQPASTDPGDEPPCPDRRRVVGVAAAAAAASLGAPAWAAGTAGASAPRRVLRVAFRNAETALDPVKVTDSYSMTVLSHIFEAPYAFDHLARPFQFRPRTAAGLPEHSADFRTWTIRIRPGIYFADDPAFQGRRRELVAQDYVYALKRSLDPATGCPWTSDLLELKIEGLQQAFDAAQARFKAGGRFDYDQPIAGLQAPERYTLVIRLEEPRPFVLESLTSPHSAAVAREVVEFYGDRIADHPVGTGPFRLKSWRRASRMVLERNPGYREHYYDAQPAADDADGQAVAARLRGRRLPMVDEVEVSIIQEEQPLWLTFRQRQVDGLVCVTGSVPISYFTVAAPGGRLAPYLQRLGVQMRRQLNSDVVITYFNMEHPVIGGYTAEKVALRRAIALAYDTPREIRQTRRGMAAPAQSIVTPYCYGYDPNFKGEMGDHDPVRARALLDLYGYVDRDGDGWRERPDGQPLVLEFTTQPEAIYRNLDELWQSSMNKVGLKVVFKTEQWSEAMKGAYAGRHMIWGLGNSANTPDGADALSRLYSPQIGNGNLARFKLPEFDRLYERLLVLPNGPQRDALFLQAKRIETTFMPYKSQVHRASMDLTHPWVIGFRRPQFWTDWWHMVDVDPQIKQQYESSL